MQKTGKKNKNQNRENDKTIQIKGRKKMKTLIINGWRENTLFFRHIAAISMPVWIAVIVGSIRNVVFRTAGRNWMLICGSVTMW